MHPVIQFCIHYWKHLYVRHQVQLMMHMVSTFAHGLSARCDFRRVIYLAHFEEPRAAEEIFVSSFMTALGLFYFFTLPLSVHYGSAPAESTCIGFIAFATFLGCTLCCDAIRLA